MYEKFTCHHQTQNFALTVFYLVFHKPSRLPTLQLCWISDHTLFLHYFKLVLWISIFLSNPSLHASSFIVRRNKLSSISPVAITTTKMKKKNPMKKKRLHLIIILSNQFLSSKCYIFMKYCEFLTTVWNIDCR